MLFTSVPELRPVTPCSLLAKNESVIDTVGHRDRASARRPGQALPATRSSAERSRSGAPFRPCWVQGRHDCSQTWRSMASGARRDRIVGAASVSGAQGRFLMSTYLVSHEPASPRSECCRKDGRLRAFHLEEPVSYLMFALHQLRAPAVCRRPESAGTSAWPCADLGVRLMPRVYVLLVSWAEADRAAGCADGERG